ncbi:Rhodanese-like domain-containing protein 11, chloroplastic [Glycine soja]
MGTMIEPLWSVSQRVHDHDVDSHADSGRMDFLCALLWVTGYTVQLSNKPLLDVRLSNEHTKAWVRASTWIPIFDVHNKLDFGTIPRKEAGGVASLHCHMTSFTNYWFLDKVEEKFPKDAELIVACQKGLSFSIIDSSNSGGGKKSSDHFPSRAPVPLKFSGIGGVSEFLGWTDQQRAAAAKEGWGYRLVFSARLIGVFLVADALYFGAQQIGRYLQDIWTH